MCSARWRWAPTPESFGRIHHRRLAAPPYDALSPAELDELVTELEPITAPLAAARSQ